MKSITLAIESSQRRAGVAVQCSDGTRHVELLSGASRHDDDLMPAISRLCDRAGVAAADIGQVGVSIGPGGFTGLRIAVTTARMLALAGEVRIAAVPSALVAAASTIASDDARVALVSLAGKGETAWLTRVERGSSSAASAGDAWEIAGTPGLMSGDGADLSGVDVVLADEHQPSSLRVLAESAEIPWVEPVFDPLACLSLTCAMCARGAVTDPLRLVPLYPREPEAVTLWNARRG